MEAVVVSSPAPFLPRFGRNDKGTRSDCFAPLAMTLARALFLGTGPLFVLGVGRWTGVDTVRGGRDGHDGRDECRKPPATFAARR